MSKIINDNKKTTQTQYGSISHVDQEFMPLVAAILETAEEDLKEAIKYRKHQEVASLKRWFLSEWGQALSGNNGQLIIDRIESEVKKERTKLWKN